MRSLVLHRAVLFFTVLWFAVILPGHQRGLVRTPGSDATSVGCAACATRGAGHTPSDGTKRGPCRNAAGHCAVCQFIGVLNVPPALIVWRPLVAAVGPHLTPVPEAPVRTALGTHHYTRGPPVAA